MPAETSSVPSAPVVHEKLKLNEEFHRVVMDNVDDLIAVVDAQGRRLYNNLAYRNILGDPEHLKGTDSVADVHPEDQARIRRIFHETIATGVGQRAEFRFLLRDGAVRHIESQGSVIRDQWGRPSQVVLVSRDITARIETEHELRAALADAEKSRDELKSTQQQLLQSEKLEAVSAFASAIAHEVKNPLQTIALGVDYLANYGTAYNDDAKMVFDHLTQGIRRCDAIIQGLMEFSPQNKQDICPQSLRTIFQQSMRSHELDFAQRRIRVLLDVPAELPLLRLDLRSVKHVFINLMERAAVGLSAGSSLFLKARLTTGSSARQIIAEIIPVPAVSQLPPPGAAHDPASDFALHVSRKIIELYGGRLQCGHVAGSFSITFSN